MKPISVKKLSQNTNCHSEPKAKNLKPSHASDSSSRCIGIQNDNFQTFSTEQKFSKNSRPGVAILVVLFVIMVATVISLSFIARSDVELAFGNNMALRMQMDYLAESGLAHAKALITNRQDVETEPNVFWAGGEGFSLKDFDFYDLLETGDYYDVVVARDDSDPTDRCNYDISCLAYRGIEKTAQSYLNARLRLDPCIAYWAGAGTTVSSKITVNGDVYCNGNLTNDGTIKGDVFASALTGIAEGSRYDIDQANVTWPGLNVNDFTPQYYFQHEIDLDYVAYTPLEIVDANDLLSSLPLDYIGNPAGVIVCSGDLTLMGNVVIDGTLIVNGDLVLNGNSLTITSLKNFPALVVNDQLNVANGRLTITGLAQVNTMSVSAAAANVTISGALFVRDNGMSVEPGYAGNITITAAPMIASTKISPDGTTTNAKRWTPIGGAFFKWIKRE